MSQTGENSASHAAADMASASAADAPAQAPALWEGALDETLRIKAGELN